LTGGAEPQTAGGCLHEPPSVVWRLLALGIHKWGDRRSDTPAHSDALH
jgi:hypothetical protein